MIFKPVAMPGTGRFFKNLPQSVYHEKNDHCRNMHGVYYELCTGSSRFTSDTTNSSGSTGAATTSIEGKPRGPLLLWYV
jgi:hypothetical protein